MASLTKAHLVELLQQASELEHSLCLSYLYASFTLKSAGEAGVTASQAGLAEQWKQQLNRIAVEEMSHMLIVNNILVAMGAPPHFWRPNFPQPAGSYGHIGIPLVLAPFSAKTVSRFLYWERPETPGWWDGEYLTGPQSMQGPPNFTLGPFLPGASVAKFYATVIQMLTSNPGFIQPGTEERQVTKRLVPFLSSISTISSTDDAVRQIDQIVRQGEGGPTRVANSHFAYFHQVLNQLQQAQTHSWPLPSRKTVMNPVYCPATRATTTSTYLISQPGVQDIGLLFNDMYLFSLRMLTRLFTPNEEPFTERQCLANATMALMPFGIKPIGTLLTQLRLGDGRSGRFAGPSFELPGGSSESALTFNQDLSLQLPLEMRSIATRCRVIANDHPGMKATVLASLAGVARGLDSLIPMLRPS